MTSGIKTVIYPVTDLARAKTLYGTLVGVAPYVDKAYYVGFRVGDQEIGLDPTATRPAPSATGTLTTSRSVSSCSSTPAQRRRKRSQMSVGAS
jgi:hypothetical protein